MAETFSRRNEICQNPVDQPAIIQLTDLLRQEFLDKPVSERTTGKNTVIKNNGEVELSTFYKADGEVGFWGSDAKVNCPEKGRFVQVSVDSKGRLSAIFDARPNRWLYEMPVSMSPARKPYK